MSQSFGQKLSSLLGFSSNSEHAAGDSDQVSPKAVMAIFGLLLLIPAGIFGYVFVKPRLGNGSSKPTSSLTPTSLPSPSPSPSTGGLDKLLESSPSPSPSTKPSPSPSPSGSPKASSSPSPSPSPTAGTNTSVDLSVDDIVIEQPSGSSYYAGQRVNLRAKLRNNGSQASGEFASVWKINGSSVGGNSHGKVKAGSDATYDEVNSLTYGGFFLKEGDNTFVYEVDTANALKEANRNNNSKTVTIKAGATRSDLEAVSIELFEQGTTNPVTTPTNGQKLTAKASFKNIGEDTQSNFSLKWFINTNEVKSVTVSDSIAKNEVKTQSYDFTAGSGNTALKFELNTSNTFPETNSGNNSKTLNFSI